MVFRAENRLEDFEFHDARCQGILEKSPQVLAGIKYDGQELWGRGKDEKSALSALQKQLPKDAVLTII